MTPLKVAELFDMYATLLRYTPELEPVRYDPERRPIFLGEKEAEHIMWMCEEGHRLATSPAPESIEKAMRWLGFIQGAFWIGGDFTIAEITEHNKP